MVNSKNSKNKRMKKSIRMTISKKPDIKKKPTKTKIRISIKSKRKTANTRNKYKLGDKVIVKKDKNNILAEIVKVNNNNLKVKYLDEEFIEKYGDKNISYNVKDVKKKHNSKKGNNILLSSKNRLEHNNKIEPLYWMMPYEKAFPDWINTTFMKYQMNGKPTASKPTKSGKKVFKPFLYQNFLRDYLQTDSPYRGILLYHGLGSGKTCTAIHIAESLKTDKDIVVMLPASLKTNFIEEGLKFCGDPIYKNSNGAINDKYSFVSYNASNVTKQIENVGSFNNKVIIIDEIHNLVSIMVNGLTGGGRNGSYIYKSLIEAENCKIIALTGTPVVNMAFELAILFNVLRGYIEMTNFRVIDKDLERDFEHLEHSIMDHSYVDYVKYNRGNKIFDVHIMVNHWHPKYSEIVNEIENIVLKEARLTIKYLPTKKGPQTFTVFPDEIEAGEPKKFNQYFIKEDNDVEHLINKNLFQRRILGLVSYYAVQQKDYPDVIMNDYIRIPMSDYQFTEYNFVREIEKKAEKQGAKESKKGTKTKTKSYFRVLSRQFSNFVFPEEIDRPWPNEKLIMKLKQAKMKKGNNVNEKEIQNILKNMGEKEGKIDTKKFKQKLEKALDELSNGNYLLTQKDALGLYSPKMQVMFENINKSKGLIFGYSNFRSVEGIEIFARILEKNGYKRFNPSNTKVNSKFDYKQFAIYSGSEDFDERKKIVKIFNDPDNKHGKQLRIILATAAGAEGLDLHNIRQIHIMEPYWNEVKIQQVIGRGVRRKSHEDLPPQEHNVEVFRYLSVFTPDQAVKAVDKTSTDEHILDLAIKKKNLTDELLELLKEASVDCWLNKAEIKGDYKCFTFGKGAKGIASLPDIMQNRLLDTSSNTKVKKTKVINGFIDKKGFILYFDKKTKKCYNIMDKLMKKPIKPNKEMIVKKVKVNIDEKKVYNIENIKSMNPPVIGTFNENGRFVEA
jgi:superfamily II DNA or RNA helicase